MNSNNYYVYIFLRTDNPGKFIYADDLSFEHEPFYVGKGICNRMEVSLKYNHNLSNKNMLKKHIIEKIHRENMEIKSFKIKENLTENEAYEYEKYVISKIGMIVDNKGPLSNLTDGGQSFLSQPVLQYDINGNFVNEFTSVGEAVAQTGIINVSPCCRGIRNMAGKYIWKYKTSENYPKIIDVGFIKKMMHFGNYERAVIQYDMNLNLLGEFSSIKEASIKSGCQRGKIVNVCKGDRKHTKGFIWKYKNNLK